MRDFRPETLRRLSLKGITILRPTAIPDNSSDLPFVNATRGYVVNDNGCGRVWTRAQVVERAS